MSEADLLRLEDEARYARERHGLYRAKTYGPQATDASHLRDLERRLDLAEKRLHQARTVRENTEPQSKGTPMADTITPEQVVTAAKDLGQAEFSRADLAKKLGVERSDLKPGFKAARQSGKLEKVGNDNEGTGQFRLTDA